MICTVTECADIVCYFEGWVQRHAMLRLLSHLTDNREDRGIAQAATMSQQIHATARIKRIADEGVLSNVTWGHPYLTITIPLARTVRIEHVSDTRVDVILSNVREADLAGLAYKLKKRELILEALFEMAELAQTGLSSPFRDMAEDGVI